LRGIGEPIRWLFIVSDIPFEDYRIPPEIWPTVKQEIPWGQLPFLEIDGKVRITQSVAIGRYLAKKFNLIPNDDLQSAKCDAMVDAVNDLRILWRPYLLESKFGTQPEKAEEMKKTLEEQEFPRFLTQFEEIIKTSGGGYIIGNKYHWADFFLANYLDIWEESMGETLLDPYPSLKTLKASVFCIPAIAKWVLKRPKTFV